MWAPRQSYFNSNSDDARDKTIHSAANSYKRVVISSVYDVNIKGSSWLVDLMCGRGADMFRYAKNKVENVLFVDSDKTAIVELIQRKFSLEKEARMNIYVMVADMNTRAQQLMDEFNKEFGLIIGGVNVITCNFAIHYMCATTEGLRNFLALVSKLLCKGGLFIFSCMNGRAVFDILADITRGKSWEYEINGRLKYAIRKDYNSKKLENVGQMISVKLPFSDELREEPLVNIDYIVGEAERFGLIIEVRSSFIDNYEEVCATIPKICAELDDTDKKYIGLFDIITLRKK